MTAHTLLVHTYILALQRKLDTLISNALLAYDRLQRGNVSNIEASYLREAIGVCVNQEDGLQSAIKYLMQGGDIQEVEAYLDMES